VDVKNNGKAIIKVIPRVDIKKFEENGKKRGYTSDNEEEI